MCAITEHAQYAARCRLVILQVSREECVLEETQFESLDSVANKATYVVIFRLSQALVHFVPALTKRLTDNNMSGLPNLAKYKHLRTICAHTGARSPLIWNSSGFQLMIVSARSFHFLEFLI